MRRRVPGLILFLFSLLAGFGCLSVTAQSASPLPIDRTAVITTIIAHRNSIPATAHRPGAVAPSAETGLPTSFSGSPYSVGPSITPTSSEPEDEEHIAVDPKNFNNLVAMISDFSLNGGFNTSKFAVSTNNGASWSENFVPLSGGFPTTSEGHVWEANSDPVVAMDKLGNVFLANLYLQVVGITVTNDGFYVCSAKLASGPTFSTSDCHPVKTTLKPTAALEDKPWIAVDNSDSKFSGTVYASWTHFGLSNSIVFSRSTDHGVTWSAPIQINLPSQNGGVQGSQVAVGPGGQVYVAYEVLLVGGQGQHFIAKSTDGGSSFSKAVPLTPVFNDLNFGASYRTNSFPALAISPVKGQGFIYDVYTDQPSHNARTAFVRSRAAGGLTFTPPVSINDSNAGQRLMPAVAADKNGVVHVCWFDNRNNPTQTDRLDIYATYSKDNGATFTPNAKVTSFQVHAGIATFLGDYSGIAAGPNGSTSLAHPVWTSGAFGGTTNAQMQSATLTVP